MSRKQKILVCGDVEGNYKTLFSRVNVINKKNGPFDFLFCVGNFFSDSDEELKPYRNGSLSVSVPTYILGPNKESHLSFYDDISGCEICPNVNYLGKYGILSSSGLKIAYISGLDGGNTRSDLMFTEKDAKALQEAALRNKDGSQFLGVDMLLSSEWPKGVENLDKNAKFQINEVKGSQMLAELAYFLKPRYHFSGLKDIFYERPPYRNSSDNSGRVRSSHTTRFIGLAKVGNIGKNKWLYAANLTPLSDLSEAEICQSTTDETACPYSVMVKKKTESHNQYFYDMDATEDIAPKRRRKDSYSKDKRKSFDDPESCWFCLASSSVEKHLVISLAEEVYLALAKGGLTPLHVMIVPVMHHRSQIDLSKKATEELKKYKSSLKKFYDSKNLVPVIFERNYKTSHLQLHVVPVPKNQSENLKEVFLNFSDDLNLKLSELPKKAKLKDYVQPGTTYFYLELPTREKFICNCQKNFPIHFGREVLASRVVLNSPDKANWRDCVQTKSEEEKLTQDFRIAFEEFDEFSE